MVAVETFFSSPLAQTALAFLLLFTLVFAILQKSKLFGEGKNQIDALVSLAVALIVTSFAYALEVIQRLMPFLAVVLVILFVFYLLFAFVSHEKFEVPAWMRWILTGVVGIAVIIAVLLITGGWDYVQEWFARSSGSGVFGNVVIAVIVIIAVLFAMLGGKRDSRTSGKKE